MASGHHARLNQRPTFLRSQSAADGRHLAQASLGPPSRLNVLGKHGNGSLVTDTAFAPRGGAPPRSSLDCVRPSLDGYNQPYAAMAAPIWTSGAAAGYHLRDDSGGSTSLTGQSSLDETGHPRMAASSMSSCHNCCPQAPYGDCSDAESDDERNSVLLPAPPVMIHPSLLPVHHTYTDSARPSTSAGHNSARHSIPPHLGHPHTPYYLVAFSQPPHAPAMESDTQPQFGYQLSGSIPQFGYQPPNTLLAPKPERRHVDVDIKRWCLTKLQLTHIDVDVWYNADGDMTLSIKHSYKPVDLDGPSDDMLPYIPSYANANTIFQFLCSWQLFQERFVRYEDHVWNSQRHKYGAITKIISQWNSIWHAVFDNCIDAKFKLGMVPAKWKPKYGPDSQAETSLPASYPQAFVNGIPMEVHTPAAGLQGSSKKPKRRLQWPSLLRKPLWR